MPAFGVGVLAVLGVQAALGVLTACGWRRVGFAGPRVVGLSVAVLGLAGAYVMESFVAMLVTDFVVVGVLFLVESTLWPQTAST